MTSRSGRRNLSGLLATFLLIGLGGLPQAVLCIAGPDHLAVEILDWQRCHPEGAADVLLAHGDDCPEACQDTPLGGGPILRQADPDAARVALAPPATVIPFEVAFRPAASRVGPAVDPALRPIFPTRTVVLIC